MVKGIYPGPGQELRGPHERRNRGAADSSVDGGDVGADEGCGLLVNIAVATVGVVLLEACKGGGGGDGVDVVVAVVVERHVREGVVGEAEDEIADVAGFGGGEVGEYGLDSPLAARGSPND